MENGIPKSTKLHTLRLAFDPSDFTMKIDGEFPNFDCALAMLAQATRALETQQRVHTAQLIQAQQRELQENARIAAQIKRTV